METVDFHALSRSVQERFAEATRGRASPAPVASVPLRIRERTIWWTVIVLTIASLIALARWGFGDASSGMAVEGTFSFAADIILVSAIGVGIVRLCILRARERALPYLRGIYVFPTSVVDARSSKLRVFPLGDVTSVDGPSRGNVTSLDLAGERLELAFPDETVAASATRAVWKSVEAAKTRTGSGDRITQRFENDPLQRPRMSSPVGPKTSIARRTPDWIRRSWALGPIAGLVLGPAILETRNLLSDRTMLRIAERTDTAEAYRRYVAAGGRHSQEVMRSSLPRAELHEAERIGTVEAIERFRDAHPSSLIADEIEAARRRALLAELARARSAGTLAALQDFAKHHPDHHLEPELRAAIHSLFAPALDAFHAHAPNDAQVRSMVERLFAFSENKAQNGSTDTTVQIRFRRLPSKTLRSADHMVEEHHWFIGEASYPSRYFDVSHATRRESELARLFGQRLGDAFGSSVFTFHESSRLDEAREELPEVSVPTLVISHREEWPHTFDGSITKPRGVWIDVAFFFEAAWLVPGEAPRPPFAWDVREKIPRAIIEANPDGGTSQAPLEEKIYGAMMDDAFAQFGRRYLALFLPATGTIVVGGGPQND